MKEVLVSERKITCGKDDDHPLVYYTIGEKDYVICGYCNTKYIYSDPAWWAKEEKEEKEE